MGADQPRLGNPNRRPVDQPAEMAGQAETARMSPPLTIAEKKIRRDPQRVECGQSRRHLPKRKQARDIGEGGRPADQRLVQGLQGREIEHNGCRAGGPAAVCKADVDAGDGVDRTEPVGSLGTACKLVLKRPRCLGREVEGMGTVRSQHRRRRCASEITRSVSDQRPS